MSSDTQTPLVRTLSALGLLVLRVGTGAMMAYGHGYSKLMGYSQMADKFPDPIGLGSNVSLIMAIFAELVCSLLLIVGAFTRLAAIPLLITMLVAAFIIHGADPWAKKEFALLYAVPFLTLMLTGAGPWSVDGWLVGRLSSRR